jgi:DNA mismatch repair protein MSH3
LRDRLLGIKRNSKRHNLWSERLGNWVPKSKRDEEEEGGEEGEDGGEEEEEEEASTGRGRGKATATKGNATVRRTPLEQQYLDIKKANPDLILMVEHGYRYRFFGDDAEVAVSTILEADSCYRSLIKY